MSLFTPIHSASILGAFDKLGIVKVPAVIHRDSGVDPSSNTGNYARNAQESLYPHLWRGLDGAYVPSLGQGGDLIDFSGNNRHGTLTGDSVVYGPNGLVYGGTDDYVVLGTEFQYTSENYTLFFHARHDEDAADMLFCNGIWEEYGIMFQIGNSGKAYITLSQLAAKQNIITNDSLYTVGVPFTVAFVRDGNEGRVYFDGVEATYATQDVLSDATTPGAITTRLGINVNGLAYDFTGEMFDVLIYRRVLKEHEIKHLTMDSKALWRTSRQFHSFEHTDDPGPSGVVIFRRRRECA